MPPIDAAIDLTARSRPGLDRKTMTVLAAACGLTVANTYFNQSLLAMIAADFGVSARDAGLVATLTQVGYALGILLIVPLGDMISSRKLVSVLLAAVSAALCAGAFAPSVGMLGLISLAIAMMAVVPQVIIPAAVSAAPHGQGGRVLAAMQLGLVIGILLSRSVSGAVAEHFGWRAAYGFFAILMALQLLILPRFVPIQPQRTVLGYGNLLLSMLELIRNEKALRLSCLFGVTSMGAFAAVWSTLAYHTAQAPFHYGPVDVGLLAVWSLPGVLVATWSGKLVDRFGPNHVNLLALVPLALAFVTFAAAGDSFWGLVAALNLLHSGMHAAQIANQGRIFQLGAEARSRLNTVFMVSAFGGAALSSYAALLCWSAAGWLGVCALGGALILAAGAILLVMGGPRRKR